MSHPSGEFTVKGEARFTNDLALIWREELRTTRPSNALWVSRHLRFLYCLVWMISWK